ncbi:MAG: AAA-like domain-containing protein [Chloroflexota bacterium]
MAATRFKYKGALAADVDTLLYIHRQEYEQVDALLTHVGTQCVIISLIGARQTGKTSLLNFLHDACRQRTRWVTIQLDLSELREFDGETWYQQLIAASCELLHTQLGITIEELTDHCAHTPVHSAAGWRQLMLLACQRLSPEQKLLVSLDEISSVPDMHRKNFFTNLRTIHQNATADRPEYRNLGLVLAGAFVPERLIDDSRNSPFNVSTKVYMNPVTQEQFDPLLRLLAENEYVISERAVQSIYSWTGGLLVQIQQICEKIVQHDHTDITPAQIDRFAQEMAVDNDYLTHVVQCVDEDELRPSLIRTIHKILQAPLRGGRTNKFIVTLESIGVIRQTTTAEWDFVNRLCRETFEDYVKSVPQGDLIDTPLFSNTVGNQDTTQPPFYEKWWFTSLMTGLIAATLALFMLYAPNNGFWLWSKLFVGIASVVTVFMLSRAPINRYLRIFWVVFAAFSTMNALPGIKIFFEMNQAILNFYLDGTSDYVNMALILLMIVLLVLDFFERKRTT